MTKVPKTLDNSPPLTPTEIADLEAHEKVIEAGRDTFVAVGLALLAVRERKLYRCTHFTFAAYAADKWGISDRHSRRLMAAAKVAEITGPIGPVSESVARELAPLAEDSGRLTKVWAEAQRLAGDAAPTACDVITARKQVKPDPPEVSSVMLTLRTHDGTEVPYPKPNSKATFNSTNEHISWAAWSWNPVTGCLHGCDYCYARELATKSSFAAAYPAGFTPLFHPERLDAPANTPVPQDAATDPRRGRVFVCSMADLYGHRAHEHPATPGIGGRVLGHGGVGRRVQSLGVE